MTPEEEASGSRSSATSGADRRWRELLELDARLHEQRGIRLLTPEARVLLYLRLEGSAPVSAAMRAARTSERGFYAVLERLRQAGLVATVRDSGDQRVRRISLSEGAPLAGTAQP